MTTPRTTDESGSDGAGALTLTVLNLTIEEAGLPKLEPSTHENGRLVFEEQDVERWRIRCVAHLLGHQAHTLAPALYPQP